MPEKPVGKVEHYYPKVQAAAVRLSKKVKLGDEVHIVGHGDDFKEKVTSLQLDHRPIQEGQPGQSVGLWVKERVHEGDDVLLVDPAERRLAAAGRRKAAPKAAAPRKAPRRAARKAANRALRRKRAARKAPARRKPASKPNAARRAKSARRAPSRKAASRKAGSRNSASRKAARPASRKAASRRASPKAPRPATRKRR